MISTILPVFVEFVPEKLDDGKIYISKTYLTASHNCCCGCGHRVVTPLKPKPKGWRLTEDGELITLYPSIGNWSFACRSHYWIRRNKIVPSYPMTPDEVDAARKEEGEAADRYIDTFESESHAGSADQSTGTSSSEGFFQRVKRWLFGKRRRESKATPANGYTAMRLVQLFMNSGDQTSSRQISQS